MQTFYSPDFFGVGKVYVHAHLWHVKFREAGVTEHIRSKKCDTTP